MAAIVDAMAGIIGMLWLCDNRCDSRYNGSDGRYHSYIIAMVVWLCNSRYNSRYNRYTIAI